MRGRTTFVVAHRLSTIRNADRIVSSDRRQRNPRHQPGWPPYRGPRWITRGSDRGSLRGRRTHHRLAVILSVGGGLRPRQPSTRHRRCRVVVASTRTGEITETLVGHDGWVTAAEFRPTGELVTAGIDGAIITWNLGDWSADIPSRHVLGAPQRGSNLMSAPSRSSSPTGVGSMSSPSRRCGRNAPVEVAGRVLTDEEWAESRARPYAPACRE